MREYLTEPKSSRANLKVELDLSNHATKIDLKNAADDDTSASAKQNELANLKSDEDKLDIYELKNVPGNLSNLKSKQK